MGVLAQLLRQVPGSLMSLGASTAPWVTVGFLLAVSASRGAHTPRRAVFAGTGTVAAYLLMWLVSYHLLFVLRESVPLAAGWREAAPWLIAAVPACPILGAVAALSHEPGLLGDTCLAAPIAWSLPEALGSLTHGWCAELVRECVGDAAAITIPVAVLVALLIRMEYDSFLAKKRPNVIDMWRAGQSVSNWPHMKPFCERSATLLSPTEYA